MTDHWPHRFRIISPNLVRCDECGHEEPFDREPYRCSRPEYKEIGGHKFNKRYYVPYAVRYISEHGYEQWFTVGRDSIPRTVWRLSKEVSLKQSTIMHGIITRGKKKVK